MNETTLESIRTMLEDRKMALMQRISKVQQDITAEHSADWSEQAQERQNDEVLEAIGIESRQELAKINKALARIDEGTYSECSVCGETISLDRLKAVPYTDRCINCAK